MKILKFFNVSYSSGVRGDMVHHMRVAAYSESAAKKDAWVQLLSGNNLWVDPRTLKIVRKHTRGVGMTAGKELVGK